MRRPKYSVECKARNRLAQAEEERQAGIPDRVDSDNRQPFDLLLKSAGLADMRIEPRLGYIAWRAVCIDTGRVLHCAALKELLHWTASAPGLMKKCTPVTTRRALLYKRAYNGTATTIAQAYIPAAVPLDGRNQPPRTG